jgi:hypothetical protein
MYIYVCGMYVHTYIYIYIHICRMYVYTYMWYAYIYTNVLDSLDMCTYMHQHIHPCIYKSEYLYAHILTYLNDTYNTGWMVRLWVLMPSLWPSEMKGESYSQVYTCVYIYRW